MAKVDQLRLLEALYGTVHIPPAVHRELWAKTGPEAALFEDALAGWLRVADRPDSSPAVQAATQSLDVGEREAVALAYSVTLPLLMDDQLGRQAAFRLKLVVTGTIGVLIESKRAGLLPSVSVLLEEMRTQGYWLSDKLIIMAAKLADE